MRSLLRPAVISFIGHAVVFGSLAFASLIEPAPRERVQVIPVKAVSPQAIQKLIEQTAPAEKPKPKVTQIKPEPEKPLPDKRWRERQTVKKESETETVSTREETTTEEKQEQAVPGMRVDQEFDHPDYLIAIRNRISTNWRPPRLNTSNQTTVFFKIKKDGTIARTFVEKRTGNMAFDMSAMYAVTKSAPFPPLPDGYQGDELGIHLEFIFEP